jgi:FixJ family two-component response regulator
MPPDRYGPLPIVTLSGTVDLAKGQEALTPGAYAFLSKMDDRLHQKLTPAIKSAWAAYQHIQEALEHLAQKYDTLTTADRQGQYYLQAATVQAGG